MRSLFATLLSLVLPSGASSGPRIVVDGVNAQILLYNLAGLLYGSITPAGGVEVFNPSTPGQRVALDIIGGLPALSLSTGDVDEDAPGRLLAVVSGVGGTRNLLLDIASANFTGGDRGRVVLRSESEDGTEPSRIHLDAAELEVNATVAQTITDTTDASGFITFTHGASTTPKAVLVEHQSPLSGPAAFCSGVDSIGATTARARFLQVSAGSVVSHATASATFRILTIV